jgi:hypothetical protein
MPQADKHALPTHKPGSIEGSTLDCRDAASRREALQTAFDYRGDVTLDLQDGSQLLGFVYLYNEAGDLVHLFIPQGKDSVPQTVPASRVSRVRFTGEDTAFGKSWDDWTTKAERERKKEAERLAKEAVERGEL